MHVNHAAIAVRVTVFQLVRVGFTHLKNFDLQIEGFSGARMIQIHCCRVSIQRYDSSLERSPIYTLRGEAATNL